MQTVIMMMAMSLLQAGEARAYIDPTAAGLAFQAIAAILSAVVISLSFGWKYIKNRVASIFRRPSKHSARDDDM